MSPADRSSGRPSGAPDPDGLTPPEREDLPYTVEVWDETKSVVERILAVTSSASIGYAAFYAATKEQPTRLITLRHKSGVISRWNGPAH